jgi:hypothetical protein
MLDVSDGPSCWAGCAGFSSSCAMLMPRWLRLFDREGAGLDVGDTRVVMIFREFIVSRASKPLGADSITQDLKTANGGALALAVGTRDSG